MANSAFSNKRWLTSEKLLYMQDDLNGGNSGGNATVINCGNATPDPDYSSYERDKIYNGGNA